MTTSDPTHEIHITRSYDAPVARVWEAWTDLTQLAQWWGPRGFSITTTAKDLRPGGTWEYTMHGPDGTNWPNFTRYHEVVERQRLVYDHGASSADAKPMFRVTVEFRDRSGATELEIRMRFATAEELEQSRAIIKTASGNSTWDRLGEFVAHEVTAKQIFLINRSVEAPIETMFEMWSNPEQVARWTPPTGFTMAFARADIRAGGASFYSMTNGQFTMYGRAEYFEIRRPDLLRYAQSFADQDGNLARHPMAPVWPEKMLTTVTLTAERATQTRVTIQWEPYGAATPEEIAAFAAAREGMTMGWTGSLDKLEEAIAATA